MLSFLFLRYLSDTYENAAQKELGVDWPLLNRDDLRSYLAVWYAMNSDDIKEFEAIMRRKVHYVIKPEYLWSSIAEMARTQDGELLHTLQNGFKFIENESFSSNFQGLFSEINLDSEKLGRDYKARNARLSTIIQDFAKGLGEFPSDRDLLGDAYEYLIGQFAAGSGKKAGEFYTPQQIQASSRGSWPWTARNRQQEKTETQSNPGFSLRLRFAAAQCALADGQERRGQALRAGKEHHHLQLSAYEDAAARCARY
jgi:type I restriction enzyme M protein